MIEKLYEDFTTKLLPTIQEGLVISRDYFVDLFGRYVKYLIISDSFFLALSAIAFIIGLVLFKKTYKYIKSKKEGREYCSEPYEFLYMIPMCLTFFGGMGIIDSSEKLIKDLTIPEIRVYEEFKNFKK